MTQLNHTVIRLVGWTFFMLVIACSMTELPTAQTASTAANRRRAQLTQNSAASTANSPNPSSLEAISASVDAEVDRRVNVDRQDELIDPSLMPLRITSPNVNGEDEVSLQAPPETRLSNGDPANNSYFTLGPPSTSWNPGRMSSSQDAPISTAQPTVDSPEQHYRRSIHGSAMADRAQTTSPGQAPIPGSGKEMRRMSVHRSNHNGLRKSGHQQDAYRRDCSKLDLSDSECRASLKQQKVFTNQRDPTQSLPESLAATR